MASQTSLSAQLTTLQTHLAREYSTAVSRIAENAALARKLEDENRHLRETLGAGQASYPTLPNMTPLQADDTEVVMGALVTEELHQFMPKPPLGFAGPSVTAPSGSPANLCSISQDNGPMASVASVHSKEGNHATFAADKDMVSVVPLNPHSNKQNYMPEERRHSTQSKDSGMNPRESARSKRMEERIKSMATAEADDDDLGNKVIKTITRFGPKFGTQNYGERKPMRIFADADAMKERVRRSILEPEYSVTQYYTKDSWWHKLAIHPLFDLFTLAVIAANALWIAVETDCNDAVFLNDAHPAVQAFEHAFCAFFFFEIVVRFMSFKQKLNCLKDSQFVFDSALVFLMVTETWVLTIFVALHGGFSSTNMMATGLLRMVRLFRLTRTVRVARLVRAMPELLVLISGIIVVLRTVVLTLFLVLCLHYVFGIMFVQMSKGTELEDVYFSTVLTSINNLMLGVIIPDNAPMVNRIAQDSVVMQMLILVFILLASITCMNMLIGILVGVVSAVAACETEKHQVSSIKRNLAKLLKQVDVDEDGIITREELVELLDIPSAARVLDDLGVDAVGLVDCAQFEFRNRDEISFSDFLDLVLQLRGSNAPRVKDLVDMRRLICMELQSLERRLKQNGANIAGIAGSAIVSRPQISTSPNGAQRVENGGMIEYCDMSTGTHAATPGSQMSLHGSHFVSDAPQIPS